MSQKVDTILQQIESLSEDDRLVLQERLQDLAEADWQKEAAAARAVARERGIDQRSIGTSINELRYGL